MGVITLLRKYFSCDHCGNRTFLLDLRLGISGSLTALTRRLLTLAGASWGFGSAAKRLAEFCGLGVSEDLIRDTCHAEARAVNEFRQSDPQATAAFRQSPGHTEFQTDATKLNTTGGWKDMKIGVFAKRPAGDAAAPYEWELRDLPRPTARMAFAAIETSESFCPTWRDWAGRLGIEFTTQIDVVADGAEWIWNAVDTQFPGATGVLDIYHACEHLAEAGKAIYGDHPGAVQAFIDLGRAALLSDGWNGICQHVARTLELEGNQPEIRQPLEELLSYFAKHINHLDYRVRLQEGRVIGSGMVEGAAKQMIGKRMKQTGARWDIKRANRMAELCASIYSDCWDNYWQGQFTGPPPPTVTGEGADIPPLVLAA